MSTYQDQIYALRTAEFAADGDECVRRDDASRIARAADAEVAKLRDLITTLRKEWQARRDAWQSRFDDEPKPSAYADVLTERVYAISTVLKDLDALLPARNPQ